MSKSNKEIDINQMLLKAHKLGVKKAIDLSARSNTRLVIYQDGKVKEVKPKYKYIRVSSSSIRNVKPSRLEVVRRKKDR